MTRNFDKSINMDPKMMSASIQLSWLPSASSLLGDEDLINSLTPKDTPTTERASRLVVFLAFVPIAYVESAFEALSIHISSTYPELMVVANYFEQSYLGLYSIDGNRAGDKFSIKHWNHYAMVLVDPNYPRTSNMIEGFHLGFKSKVNRPKPTVQEYFKAVRDQQVSTDYHLDRLEQGMTPAKKRKTNNHVLYNICLNFEEYDCILNYLFEVAKYFGHEV